MDCKTRVKLPLPLPTHSMEDLVVSLPSILVQHQFIQCFHEEKYNRKQQSTYNANSSSKYLKTITINK